MLLEEVKKIIYKQRPIAQLVHLKDKVLTYDSTILVIFPEANGNSAKVEKLFFSIPIEETEGATFEAVMPAKLLIRWLNIELCGFIEIPGMIQKLPGK